MTADARSILGSSTTGDALFVAASKTAARTELLVNVEWITVAVQVAATTAGKAYVAVPANFGGTIDSILAVNSADPGGAVVFTTGIGASGGPFTSITSGGFTVANGAAGGTKVSASPSAAKTVVGGTSVIEVAWDNGAANAVSVSVSLGITRTA